MRLLMVSTPVGPLGSGLGGGVELTVTNLVGALQQQGHELTIVAPKDSQLSSVPVVEIGGALQITAHTQGRNSLISLPPNSVLEAMWDYARQMQQDYDLLVNFAYDWLPFYLTPFFDRAIAHFVSMGSLNDGMDAVIHKTQQGFPGTLGVYTQTQANTFPNPQAFRCLGSAVDLSLYDFCATPQAYLTWMGRISPEKGLEDAIAAAERSQIPLKILGKVEDHAYWDRVRQTYPEAPIDYLGFLSTQNLQQVVRESQALLMTPRWVEAFGNVAIEALACGVPVIAYARGGPTEIIRPGQTGWLVEPDSVNGLVDAIAKIDALDRIACRRQAETEYSLEALGERFEAWFEDILAPTT